MQRRILEALLRHPDTGYCLRLWDLKAELFGTEKRNGRSGARIVLSAACGWSQATYVSKTLRMLEQYGLVQEAIAPPPVRHRDKSLRAFQLTNQALRELGVEVPSRNGVKPQEHTRNPGPFRRYYPAGEQWGSDG